MLKKRLQFILKDTALYGLASALSKVIIFLTLPIIVNRISVAEFGIWNLMTIVGLIMSSVVIFGMDSAVIRYYYDEDSHTHRQKVFTSGISLQLIFSGVFLIVEFLLPGLFMKVLLVPEHYLSALKAIFIWIPANVICQYCQNWFKWTFQRWKFLTLSLGLAFTNLAALYLCTLYIKIDLNIILIINAFAYWTFALIGLYWCRKYIKIQWHTQLNKRLLVFGLPMMLVMLIGNLSSSLDRLLLNRFMDEEALGIYSFAQRLSIIMMVVVSAFQTAFGPFSFSIWNNKDAPETFSKFQSYYLIATGLVGVTVASLINPIILTFGNSAYLASAPYLPVFIIASIVYGLYSFASIGIFHAKKMFGNLLSLCVGMVINFSACYSLIPVIGPYGAVMGFLLGNLVMVASAYFFSAKYYAVAYSFKRDVFIICLVGLALVAASMPLHHQLYWDAILKIMVITPAYIAFTVVFILDANERSKISLLLRGKLKSLF
jgi:O-antigen/teichoic acid export membrane protein